MGNSVNLLIKQINEGKNLKENLSVYTDELMELYRTSASLELTMEYYTLFEMTNENLNPYLVEVKDTCSFIHETMYQLFDKKKSKDAGKALMDALNVTRQEITKKMQVLTAYVDQLLIYEFVLNRVEYRVTMREDELEKKKQQWDSSVFVQKLIQYIFHAKDNMVINANIREVIGQLPVRYTKAKFFELLCNSLSVYKGADKSSVDNYIYMLRTSAMLYEPEGMQEYFTEFADIIKELAQVDYKEIDQSQFDSLAQKLEKASNKAREISDLYVSLQKLINDLYAFALTSPFVKGTESTVNDMCSDMLNGLHRSFSTNSQENFDQVSEMLYNLEGSMEECYEKRTFYEAVLYEIRMSHSVILEELGIEEPYATLELIQKLLSSSLFIDLEEEDVESVADSDYVNQKVDVLIGELTELFSRNQRVVTRAVMAAVISKMPVFFETSQEVVDFITKSLDSCSDMAEKFSCVSILDMIMEEE